MFHARCFRSRSCQPAVLNVCLNARYFCLGGFWTGLFLTASPCAWAAGEYGTAYSNQAIANYEASGLLLQTLSPIASITDTSGHMGDWAGQVTNLAGTTVGLYEVDPQDPSQTNLGSLTVLSPPGKNGLLPNTANLNPFVLSQTASNTFVFLLDPSQGQLAAGREYLLQNHSPSGFACRLTPYQDYHRPHS